MSVATLSALNAKLQGPTQRIHTLRNGAAGATAATGSGLCSDWITANGLPTSGVTPTTAAVVDRTTPGALGQFNKAGTEQRAWFEAFDLPFSNIMSGGIYLLVDRLVHVGGFDGTSVLAQSNGAWPALTRSTTGLGVWAAVEIYVAIGGTATTATISYTNDAGTAGRTSQPCDIGGAGRNGVRRILPISLQSGDKGVKSIASVTLLATTGTVGNFGLTLFKTLGMWISNNSGIPLAPSGRPLPNFGPMPAIPDDACLQLLYIGASGASTTAMGGLVSFFED